MKTSGLKEDSLCLQHLQIFKIMRLPIQEQYNPNTLLETTKHTEDTLREITKHTEDTCTVYAHF